MDFFESSPPDESIASLIVLGYYSMEDNVKFEKTLGGLYLSSYFLSRLDLLMTEVCNSTFSSDSVDPFES